MEPHLNVHARITQHLEAVINLLHVLQAVLIIKPGILLGTGHPKGNRGKKNSAYILALPVIGTAVLHLVLTALYNVQNTQGSLVLFFAFDFDDKGPPLISLTIFARAVGGDASGVRVEGQVMASFQRTVFAAGAGVASMASAPRARASPAKNSYYPP